MQACHSGNAVRREEPRKYIETSSVTAFEQERLVRNG